MARTYWRKHPDGSFEFLGAFADGHKVKAGTPQADGITIDIPGLGIEDVIERLAERVTLAGLPTAIVKRIPGVVPWAQMEGYVK